MRENTTEPKALIICTQGKTGQLSANRLIISKFYGSMEAVFGILSSYTWEGCNYR